MLPYVSIFMLFKKKIVPKLLFSPFLYICKKKNVTTFDDTLSAKLLITIKV